VLTRQGKDTLRIDAPVRAFRCTGPGAQIRGGLLLQGANGGNGVVVWLRTRDSVTTGPWPVVQRGDTLSPRGATVGVRFVPGGACRGGRSRRSRAATWSAPAWWPPSSPSRTRSEAARSWRARAT